MRRAAGGGRAELGSQHRQSQVFRHHSPAAAAPGRRSREGPGAADAAGAAPREARVAEPSPARKHLTWASSDRISDTRGGGLFFFPFFSVLNSERGLVERS